MWNMSLVWWEFVLRGIIIYFFLIVLLRLTGKRQVGQLAPFDLVLLLVLSNAVQNAMNGGDNSVIGGMISAVTLGRDQLDRWVPNLPKQKAGSFGRRAAGRANPRWQAFPTNFRTCQTHPARGNGCSTRSRMRER
jgi:hypothetical protein